MPKDGGLFNVFVDVSTQVVAYGKTSGSIQLIFIFTP
jgi:hypothetical protein